jgi:hypothetical protein
MKVTDFYLMLLEMLHDEVITLTIGSRFSNDNTGAIHNLPRFSFLINLAQASPLPQIFTTRYLEDRDFVLLAKRLDELLIHIVIAGLCKDTDGSFATRKRLRRFAQATIQLSVEQGTLNKVLDGCGKIQGWWGSNHGILRDFNSEKETK